MHEADPPPRRAARLRGRVVVEGVSAELLDDLRQQVAALRAEVAELGARLATATDVQAAGTQVERAVLESEQRVGDRIDAAVLTLAEALLRRRRVRSLAAAAAALPAQAGPVGVLPDADDEEPDLLAAAPPAAAPRPSRPPRAPVTEGLAPRPASRVAAPAEPDAAPGSAAVSAPDDTSPVADDAGHRPWWRSGE